MESKKITDIIVNIGSLGVMAVGTLLFNAIITFSYKDASVLSIFNQCYAYYIVFSQFGVFGFQNAILYYASKCKNSISILIKCMKCCSITSIIASLLLIGLGYIYSLLVNDIVGKGLIIISLAILPFSINKVLLNYLNAKKQMKEFAIYQSSRNLIIAMILLFLSIKKTQPQFLLLSFLIEEYILMFAILIFSIAPNKELTIFFENIDILDKDLFNYGISILPSNIVTELNTRLDVICLGLLINDQNSIGIYSFSLIFADGFQQLLTILKRIYNPEITSNIKGMELIKKELNEHFKSIVPIIGAITVLSYYIITLFIKSVDYSDGIIYLAIIILSYVLTYRSFIFGNILSLNNFPKEESILNIITVIINVCLNIIIIKFVGVIGAAIATCISHLIYAILLSLTVREKMKIEI